MTRSLFRVAGAPNSPHSAVQTRLAMAQHMDQTAERNDWNVATPAPIRTAPAVYSDWVQPLSTDLVVFATDQTQAGSGAGLTSGASSAPTTGNLFVLTNIHSGSAPTLQASTTASGFYGLGAIEVSLPSATADIEIFALSTAGQLSCFNASDLSACTGWSNPVAQSGNTVTWSTINPSYDDNSNINRIYWGDDGGELNCVVTTYGSAPSTCSGYPISLGSAALAEPTVNELTDSNWQIVVGDASGNVYQINDSGSAPSVLSGNLGGSAPGNAVRGAPALDTSVGNGVALFVANGAVYEYDLSTFSQIGTLALSPAPTGGWSSVPISSTPALDANYYIYVTANNTLFQMQYASGGTAGLSNETSTALAARSTSPLAIDGINVAVPSQPLGYPLPYNGEVYVGTGLGASGTGMYEEYACTASSSAPGLLASTVATTTAPDTPTAYGGAIETGALIDWQNGDLIFGYDTLSNSGGLVQYGLPGGTNGNWGCPGGYASGSLACGTTGCTLTSPACLSSEDCTSGQTCNSYACVTPSCTPAGSNSNNNCASATPVCVASGTTTTCVQCTSAFTGACTSGTPECDPSDSCVQCTLDSQCPKFNGRAGKGICDTVTGGGPGQCECVTTADCPSWANTTCDPDTGYCE